MISITSWPQSKSASSRGTAIEGVWATCAGDRGANVTQRRAIWPQSLQARGARPTGGVALPHLEANCAALGIRVRELDGSIQEEPRDLRNAFLKRTLRDPRNLGKMIELATHPPVGLFLDQAPVDVLYGTDLGNVSQVVPAIHPMIGIGGTANNNTAEFTPQADTDQAYRAMLDGGVALAWTALDAATDSGVTAYLLKSASTR
jgi:hypothetical protein